MTYRRQGGYCTQARMTGYTSTVLCGPPRSMKKVMAVYRWSIWPLLVDANW